MQNYKPIKQFSTIIAEYNPYHNGHAYHVQKTREANGGGIAAVMSGNFVQRGGCAVIDKFRRTYCALQNGVDVVIELPCFFAASSAETFAQGAVALADAIGSSYLSFGAETPDLERLDKIAEFFADESAEFKDSLKLQLKNGLPFARARGIASGLTPDMPNDILAAEYLKAMKRLGSAVVPVAVERKGAAHDGDESADGFMSASRIRELARSEDVSAFVPEETLIELKNNRLADFCAFSGILHYKLLYDSQNIANINGVAEGIENRILAAAKENFSIADIAQAVKSKRFAMSAIRRMLAFIILGVTKENAAVFRAAGPRYARVLGFRRESAWILTEIEKNCGLPLIMNAKNAEKLLEGDSVGKEMFALDVFAADLYRAVTGFPRSEYTIPLVVV